MTARAFAAALVAAAAFPALGQDACPQRGDLDTIFCDADGDLLADRPTDASKLKNPDTLFFNRRLVVEGDTEIALLVKNTLDTIDIPRTRGILKRVLRAAGAGNR